MSLEIVKSGVLDTVQDIGRLGYSKWGIGPGGVMDHYAARIANALVGNDAHTALIEMHFPAADILFHRDAFISITGADMMPSLDGHVTELWKPIVVKAGTALSFQRRRKGARCYLAIRGGIGVKPWLESCSTNLKVNGGGFHGRALRKGDIIPLQDDSFRKPVSETFRLLPWSVNRSLVYDSNEIFFTSGHEWCWLSEMSRRHVLSNDFTIESTSDRMAYHLRHEPLSLQRKEELLSSAVCAGTIQALPAGNLLILMADHQTTGGYPRIGHVSSAHLPRLAQLHAGEAFRLKEISMEESEHMVLSLCRDLQDIASACRKKLEEYEAIN